MKKWLKIIIVSLIIAVIVFLITAKKSNNNILESEAEKILKSLTLEQKIGQLFIMGIEGDEVTENTENLIKTLHPGGILLLGRNVKDSKQLKNFITELQEISIKNSGIPLFIAVDQEGGPISRVDWLEKTLQSEIENGETAYNIGKKRAEGLKELGINLNLAPLLDESSAGDFIFERTFKQDAEKTGELAAELIKGQKEGGILTTIKHFPGYGGIKFNPEDKLATINQIPEFYQFKTAAQSGPEMIMVVNVICKEIDPEVPLTFSRKAIDFLKKEVSGDYLIISDDLSQYSLLNNFTLTDIVSLPIKAGVDILIFSGWRIEAEKGPDSLRKALQEGKISEKEIDDKVLKIIKLKEKIK